MNISLFLIIIWIHYIADFIFQNDTMAINKSSSNKWLALHCLIYSISFICFGIISMILIGVTHFIVDYITSRGTTKLWLANKRHWFFCLIGFDQVVHITILILIIKYL
jgi:membrane-bound metal-dependent hydrolase YbcI (DUF457 family)